MSLQSIHAWTLLLILLPRFAIDGAARGGQGDKFPPELVRFSPYRGDPVFKAAKGQWDARIRERGWILREDGLYKLWYTGYDGTKDGLRMHLPSER
jgi:hypothetical protein